MLKKSVAYLLVFSLAVGFFTGCGANKGAMKEQLAQISMVTAPELTGIKKMPQDGIGKPGVDFPETKTGPADDWEDIAAPYFNPLGSYSLYSQVNYEKNGEEQILRTIERLVPKTQYVKGEVWNLSIPTEDGFSIPWLRWYTKNLGGTIYEDSAENSVFSVRENESTQWWADARVYGDTAELCVIKTQVLPIGKELTFKKEDLEEGEYFFYVECTPGKLQSATVSLRGPANSGIDLLMEQKISYGCYEYSTYKEHFSWDLNTKKTDTFVLDDLPIAEGMVCYRFRDTFDSLPDEIKVRVDNVADLEKIKWGESMGGIRVSGIPMGMAEVETPDWLTITHDKLLDSNSFRSVTEENGEMLFEVPAGYYTIAVPSGLGTENSYLSLVPVSAGELPPPSFPEELKAAVGAMSRNYGDFELNEGGIELLANEDKGDTATVSLVLNDPLDRDVTLDKQDIKITEDGAEAEIINITREPAGSDIILVLDSSGSMGQNMRPCIESAQRFVAGLPENSNIRLIQFAQAITEHKGEGKAAVLKALGTVKSVGATSLYDATARAIELLKDKKRGYAVVFSDGADSREPGIDGTGSSLTKEGLLGKIKNNNVTVLTIGFGKGHDPATLIEMAKSSPNGAYFVADDKNALDGVFASVAGKLGNQFLVDYKRPTVAADENSSVPVVSLMIDRSGSMDDDPAEDPDSDVDWRLDKVKAMFHKFILDLPEGSLLQVGSFAEPEGGTDPCYDQITTDRKAAALQGLGSLVAGGGTPTRTALELAYRNLSTVPSKKRVLVFFTDAAIAGGDDEAEIMLIHEMLGNLKKSGVRVLIAGLLNSKNAGDYEAGFRAAAQAAGGDYVVTDKVEDIHAKLNELLKRIDEPVKRAGVEFTLGIDCLADDGSRLNLYTGKTLEKFAPRTKVVATLTPSMITISMGEKVITYDRKAAELLYGNDRPDVGSHVLFRVPFKNKNAANKYAALSVTEAYVLDLFRGINPPTGKAFLALNTTLAFKKADSSLKEKGYTVPNIFNHFYVSFNEGQMMPASEATWLAETPFVSPGDAEITVMNGETRNGMLVFVVDVPDERNIKELALNLYDTANGHIQLALTGGTVRKLMEIDQLPTTVENNISEAFSLTITGSNDLTTLEGVIIPQSEPMIDSAERIKRDASFRVIEARFASKVQALLDIDPQERLLYQVDTDQGVLLSEMSDIVYNLPLGFTGKTMLAPGSCSNVRLPFVLPKELLKVQSSIYGDLQDGSLSIPVTKGSPYVTGSIAQTFSHEYFNLRVNSLTCMGSDSNNVVLDFTLEDKKDGLGTGGLEGVLQLQKRSTLAQTAKGEARKLSQGEIGVMAGSRKGLGNFADSSQGDENIIEVNTAETAQLLFGAYNEKGNWGAFDGQKRRGILIFSIPNESRLSEWALTSTLLPDVNIPVSESVYPYQGLLGQKPEIPRDTEFEASLAEAVAGAVTKYLSTRPEPKTVTRVGLSDAEILGEQVPAPALTLYGSQRLQNVQSEPDFFNVMNGAKCLPSIGSPEYYYAPEAVLTQGWGSQYDLAILAHTMLARLGYEPKYAGVRLTDVGKENLRRLGAVEDVPEFLPAVSYTNANGELRMYVPVFCRDLSELYGLCQLTTDLAGAPEINPAKARLVIEMTGKLIGNAGIAATQGMMGDMAAALGGEEGGSDFYETVQVFEREFSLPDMSLDAIDISYISTAKSEGGELILPVLDTRQGLLYDESGWVDTSNYEFESITIRLGEGSTSPVVHSTILGKDQKITEICHTLAWGIPEMSSEAAIPYEKMVKAEAAAAKDPANYSIARWIGHATINRFVRNSTDFGRETAHKLEVTAGRIDNPIALIATMKSDTKKAEVVVDLMNHRNQLHSGEEEAQWAYNLMCGYHASLAEASAIPTGEGISYLEVWSQLPKDTNMFILAPMETEQYEEAVSILTEKGYPPLMIKRLAEQAGNGMRVYLMPDRPAIVDGMPRWAWLEIDQETYDVISVFETGERAGMGEYLIGLFPENCAEIGVGAIVGITTAVWGVSTFSLSLDDYEDIKNNAKALCEDVGAQIAKVTGITGSIGQMGKLGELIGKETLAEVLAKITEMAETEWIQPGFGTGYKAAVDWYFKNMK